MNCSRSLKFFANSWPSVSNFKWFFSQSLEHFFLTVGQNNFGNKISFSKGKEEKKQKKTSSNQRENSIEWFVFLPPDILSCYMSASKSRKKQLLP